MAEICENNSIKNIVDDFYSNGEKSKIQYAGIYATKGPAEKQINWVAWNTKRNIDNIVMNFELYNRISNMNILSNELYRKVFINIFEKSMMQEGASVQFLRERANIKEEEMIEIVQDINKTYPLSEKKNGNQILYFFAENVVEGIVMIFIGAQRLFEPNLFLNGESR